MTGTLTPQPARAPRRRQGADVHRPDLRRARGRSTSGWPPGSPRPRGRRAGAGGRDRRQAAPRPSAACKALFNRLLAERRGRAVRRGAPGDRLLIGTPNQVESVMARHPEASPPALISPDSLGRHRAVAWRTRHRIGSCARSTELTTGRKAASIVPLSGQRRPGIHPADRDFVDEDDARTPDPGPLGSLRPRFEHDACGVSFVADIKGRASRRIVAMAPRRALQPRAPRRHRRRGRHRRRRRHPDPGPRPLPARGRRLRAASGRARTPSGWRSCPPTTTTREKAIAAIEAIVRRRGPDRARLARRARSTRRTSAPSARAVHAGVPAAVHRRPRRRRPASTLDRKVFVARKRIEHELAGRAARRTSRRCRPDPHLQGHVHHAAARRCSSPTCRTSGSSRRSPSCTAASRPTPSRRGRSPTRTGSSPTTARSTPCRATATGCGPARRCSHRDLLPGDSSGPSRSARPAQSDSASFDEVLELLHLGGRSLPHAC